MRQSEIRFVNFLIPALCEFIESMLFIFGLAQLLPSMSMVTKALALPISAIFCRLSFLYINKTFNWRQIVSLTGIMLSVAWLTLASLDSAKTRVTSSEIQGCVMLCLSACFQAFEVCLEQRLFGIEKELSALRMQQAISIWKIVLSTVFFVICNMFTESLGEVTGANVETFFVFLSNLGEAK